MVFQCCICNLSCLFFELKMPKSIWLHFPIDIITCEAGRFILVHSQIENIAKFSLICRHWRWDSVFSVCWFGCLVDYENCFEFIVSAQKDVCLFCVCFFESEREGERETKQIVIHQRWVISVYFRHQFVVIEAANFIPINSC